ncbi:MAG: hypothetical protein Q8P54_02350 [bacterium]|nr:hypothetical protein [bacterium]
MILNPYKKIRKSYISIQNNLYSIENRIIALQQALARVESRQLDSLKSKDIKDYEFKVFSQWGEDGIIQYLLKKVKIKNKIFVEFGVEDYLESNTRYLLTNDNWSGIVFDGNEENINAIRNHDLYWRHNLKAEHAFIDKININRLLTKNGIKGNIGLLSIDIDGNDYWIWEAIDVIQPTIVVIEFNSRLGDTKAITVPYKNDFDRSKAHPSMIYFGASLAALYKLGNKKGYDLVGCNSAGVNAFFVRRDLRPKSMPKLTPKAAFVRGEFREARGANGEMNYLNKKEEEKLLEKLPFVRIDGK